MKTTKASIHELESQMLILEQENDALATLAETNVLLYNAFLHIQENTSINDVYQTILEHIAIVLHIPIVGVFQREGFSFTCSHLYSLSSEDILASSIECNLHHDIKKRISLFAKATEFSCTNLPASITPTQALFVALASKYNSQSYIICFSNEQEYVLIEQEEIMQKLANIVSSQLDTLYYKQQLEYTNHELEKIVEQRTRELVRQNNEYIALNQEYKVLNDELYAAKIQAEQNEIRYKEIFDSSIDAIFIHNTHDDKIEDVNHAMLVMYGYNKEEIPILRIGALSADTLGYTSEKALTYIEIAKQEGLASFEWYAKKKNGELFWVFVVLKPIVINNKSRIMAIVRDINQQKITKEAIRISEEKFSKAFMSSPDSIVISSLEQGIYIDVNDTFLKQSGYSRDEVIGKSSIELRIWNSEDDRKEFVRLLKKQGFVRNFEAEYCTKTGEIGISSISSEIIQIHEQTCILSQSRDITQSKRVQQENDYRRQVLDTLLANLPIGVFMVEAHSGKPIVANAKASELLGRGVLPDANEATINEVYQAYLLGTNNKYPLDKMPIIRGMHGEKSHVDDMIVYKPNGEYSILEIFGAPVCDDNGNVVASLVSFFDIKERKNSEQALAQKTKELEQFFLTSLDLLCIADIKGYFIRVNKEWEHVLGYDSSELEHHSFLEFVHPDDLQNTVETISTLGNQISILNFTNRYRCKDGTYRWIEWRSAPQGEYIYAAARDITERKLVEQELLHAKQKAEESDTLKTAFLQNMSHEIRTPLNAIMGFSELLPETFGDMESLQKFSSIIRQRSADLLEIINDILDIAKIESGQLSIHTETCLLRTIIHEVELFFNEYRIRIKKEHIDLIIRIEPHVLETTIIIDQIKLKQILINLITNAFKFTHSGYIELGCTIHESNMLFMYVSDTGIGISAEDQTRIFKRFVQASTDTTGVYNGTGLGLPIIQGILNLVGGDIRLTSEIGKGSTFYFTFPFELPSVLDSENVVEHIDTLHSKLGLRVLIVEDDEFNAQYLEALLNQWKCYVDKVSYGKKAIYTAADKVFDVILMDIRLPDITGYEATAEILSQNPQQKIIAQTAFAGIDEKNKAMRAGFINYISKPIQRKELYVMLNDVKSQIE